MTLLELIERIRKKDEVEFTGFDDKAVHIDKDLNLYTRDGQFYVLVAIPDMQERIEFERMVDQIGCFVTTVTSGIECLDAVNRDKFDLIFISRNMPRMDGVQTLRNMRNSLVNKSKDAKVYIILEEKVDEPDIFFENAGFNGIIRKPVDRTILQDIIIDLVPEKMLPDDEELLDEIRDNAEDAIELKGSDIRYLEGLRNYKGDVAGYKTDASAFCDSYEIESANLLDMLYTNKNQEYMDGVRKLRETSRKLGAIYLADCFDDHVNMAKEDSLEIAESNWQNLVSEWEKVVAGFSKWMGKEGLQTDRTDILVLKTNGIKLSNAEITERAEDILASLEENRKDEALKKFNRLCDYELSAEKRRKVDQIRRAFDKENINTAVDILRGL